MPNHITNVLRISAYSFKGVPDGLLDSIVSAVKSEDRPFDFNRIIPMPESLGIDSGSKTISAKALADDALALQELPLYQRRNPELKTIQDLRAHLRKEYPDLDSFAETVRSNIAQYGFSDWYGWCPEHWGTKWNSYACIGGALDKTTAIYHFESAWAPPLPVLDKLASMFPQADFRLIWCDEGSDKQNRVYWSEGKRETDDE